MTPATVHVPVEAGFTCISTHSDVEDGDYVEGRGDDGAHAFDGGLVQAVVGWQHLPVRDKQPDKNTAHAARRTHPHGCCSRAFMCRLDHHIKR